MAVIYSLLEESSDEVACFDEWHGLAGGTVYCIIDSRLCCLPEDA